MSHVFLPSILSDPSPLDCIQLTDMSVFELSQLPKLRRIGLVRVSNLTDQAIYALGERHSTLERIHLSYCDQISVLAVHFLLQKLPKLTHLSLTGIPAFRRQELQQFCRDPPPVRLCPKHPTSLTHPQTFIFRNSIPPSVQPSASTLARVSWICATTCKNCTLL